MTTKSNEEPYTIEEVIDVLLKQLAMYDVDSAEYGLILDRLERLEALKAKKKNRFKFSPDTLLIVGGNLAGILMIVSYEHAHVVTSKALSFVLKGRI